MNCSNQPNALAAGLWRDLYPPAGGCGGNACITYGITGNHFAVSYNNVRNYANASRQTFQIVLNSDNSIVYQYAGVTNDVTTSIGVENQTGTLGMAYSAPSNGLAIKFTPGNPTVIRQNLQYSYDNVGNILSIVDNLDGSRTQNFIYDDLNRLTQAQSPAYGTISYQYNEIGNMTYNSQVGTYEYLANPFKPHAVSRAGSFTYAYDANGNMTNKNGTTIAYDYDNRPASIGANTFVYNHAGQRVKKNGTVYIGKLYECTGGSCTKYIYAGGSRIALKSGATVGYYHTDHLGSSSVITDNTGAKIEEVYYYPFGATRVNSGPANVKHKYTSQELDSESGLYYYGARYYDPSIGRFITADTIVQAPGDPQTLNRYSYVRNNPLIFTDPDGHYFWAVVAIGAVIGAVSAGSHSDWNPGEMLKGAVIGAVAGATGYGGWYAAGAAGAGGLTSAIAGGAAGGAAGGGTSAVMYGGQVG